MQLKHQCEISIGGGGCIAVRLEGTKTIPICFSNVLVRTKKSYDCGRNSLIMRVEKMGFEPTTSCMPCKRSSQLSYIPLKMTSVRRFAKRSSQLVRQSDELHSRLECKDEFLIRFLQLLSPKFFNKKRPFCFGLNFP